MTDTTDSSERLGGANEQELHDTWTFRVFLSMAVFGTAVLTANAIVGLPPLAWDVITVIVGVFVFGMFACTTCIIADALLGEGV